MKQSERDALHMQITNEKASTERWFQDCLRLKDQLAQLTQDATRMRGGLLLIAEWREPYKGFSFDHGSNGERDHFRKVARDALP